MEFLIGLTTGLIVAFAFGCLGVAFMSVRTCCEAERREDAVVNRIRFKSYERN